MVRSTFLGLWWLVSMGQGYTFVAVRHPASVRTTFFLSSSSSSSGEGSAYFSDEEWHPRDPASTTPQLLAGLWHQISHAGSLTKGETYTVLYPEMEEQLNQKPPRYLNNILGHLDYCKDVCDHFGMTTNLIPYVDEKSKKILGFTSTSYKKPKPGAAADDDNEFNFGYDPYWDDGTDFEQLYSGVDDYDLPKDPYPQIVNKVPDDDEEIMEITKNWVQTMMSNLGICPFSPNAKQAGLPVGPVFYTVDRATSVEDMYARFWEEVVRVEQQTEKDLSTTLLIMPEFFLDNVELFESFGNTLTQPLVALKVEDLTQLIFFHPHWSFRDGGDRATQGQAANYARRSPWPMINILRTKQVRAAQKGIPTGLVYKQNEKTLNQIGVDDLETMLRIRDWSALADKKVNRREMDALKIAQDFQQQGFVSKDDMNLANDATPLANRIVDRKQVEQGNLVNILQQALEKRLGDGDRVVPLSGPETSATSMATEYLLQELEKIVLSSSTQAPEPKETKSPVVEPQALAPPQELSEARRKHLEQARRSLMDDLAGEEELGLNDRGNEMTDVLFGRGGVKARSKDDDDIDAFRSFQGF